VPEVPLEEGPEAAEFVPEAVPAVAAVFCVEAFGAGGALLHPENAGIKSSADTAVIM
jgi:hypothetical protein